MAEKRGLKLVTIQGKRKGQDPIQIYSGVQVKRAADHVLNMPLYDASRVLTLIYAAYAQGKKDGERAISDKVSAAVTHATAGVRRLPGRPKKKKVSRAPGRAVRKGPSAGRRVARKAVRRTGRGRSR